MPAGLTADITPATLVLQGVAAAAKVYDGNTTATLGGTLGGLVAGDAVTLSLTGAFANANAGAGKTVNYSAALGGAGLSPERFALQRGGRDRQAINFDADERRLSFSASPAQLDLPEGAQDRLSWWLQLAALVQAHPAPGGRWRVWVAGLRGEALDLRFHARPDQYAALPGADRPELDQRRCRDALCREISRARRRDFGREPSGDLRGVARRALHRDGIAGADRERTDRVRARGRSCTNGTGDARSSGGGR